MNRLMIEKQVLTMSILVFWMTIVACGAAGEVLVPVLDKDGKFWVYKDGQTLRDRKLNLRPVPPYGIPFLPYAWMDDAVPGMMQMNLNHGANPYKGDKCIAVSITWASPYWCGVGFISGPDKGKAYAPWWGKTKHGWYYDLSNLKRKNLILHMRGEQGGEKVQWKVGFLGHEKFGDSMAFPKESEWFTLKKDSWTKFTIDLSKADLSRICSLCFVVAQVQQEDTDSMTFYVDSMYFE